MLRDAVEAFEALAARRPLLLVFEDLQWADGATIDLLSALMRRGTPARILVVATASTPALYEVVQELCLRGAAEEIALRRLGPEDVEAFLRARLGGKVPEGLAGVLGDLTGGNPLFMGHLVDHWAAEDMLDAAPDALAAAVPGGLRASIEHSVRALDPGDPEVLMVAGLVGREFDSELLAATLDYPSEDVEQRCAWLAESTALIEHAGEGRYAFTHDLHRSVVAGMLSADERVEAHRRIGLSLLAASANPEDIANELAVHFVAGREPELAVRFLKLAAERALGRLAHAEGIQHLRDAVAAAEQMPAGVGRSRAEVELLSMLGQAVVAVDGWSSQEAMDCLVRARALAEELDDNEPLVTVMLAVATLHEVRGEYGEATALAEQASALIPGHDASRHLQNHELLACSLFHQGSFARALEHAEHGLELFVPADPVSGTYDTFPATLGDNAGVTCQNWAALATWYLGRPDEALERANRALALSEEPIRVHSRATACAQLAVVHQCRREPGPVRTFATATVEAATERGYAYRVAMGRILRGWATAMLGDPELGVGEITSGLHASWACGAYMDDPYYLGLLAEAYLQLGDVESGLSAIDEALQLGARERSHFFEAELLRLRAALLLSRDPADGEAERHLDAAVVLAREQGAVSLELRAAVALARIRIAQGRHGEARGLVAPLLDQLVEGHESPDAVAAIELLAERGPATVR
jgi:predicted ATPase